MTKQEFIAEAKRRGKSKEETLLKFQQLEASGAFTDSAPEPEPVTSAQPKQDNMPEFKRMIESGEVKAPGALETIGGFLSLPTTILGSVRKNPETGERYSPVDPQSALLRPEMEKAKKAVEEKNIGEPTYQSQGFSGVELPRTEEQLKQEKESETAFNKGVIELGGSALSDPTLLAGLGKKAVQKGLGLASKAKNVLKEQFLNYTEELTKVPKETLMKASTKAGRTQLQAAAGTERALGQKLNNIVENYYDYLLSENEVINKALKEMPPIKFDEIFETIESIKAKELSPQAISANRKLDALKDIYKKFITKEKDVSIYNTVAKKTDDVPLNAGQRALPAPTTPATRNEFSLSDELTSAPKDKKIGKAKVSYEAPMSPNDYIEARRQLDNAIKSVYQKDAGQGELFEKQALKIRTAMKNALEEAAVKSGNPEYVTAMKDMHEKLDKLDALKEYLGGPGVKRQEKAQKLIDNLFTKNKDVAQQTLSDISGVVGDDLVEKAKLAQQAEEYGNKGRGAITPQWTTGKSLMGNEMLGKVAGTIVGSPKIAAEFTIPQLRNISNTAKSLGMTTEELLNLLSKGRGIPALSSAAKNLSKKDEEEEKKKKINLQSIAAMKGRI